MTAALLEVQLFLKNGQGQKMPKYGIPLLSLTPDTLALITIGTMLVNGITRSEYDDGLAPGATAVRYEIGQRCRLERIFDCLRAREVDLVQELRSRNRSRDAGRRATELARKLVDDEDWAKNFRSFHLGAKLMALAVRFAVFDGQPIFELKNVRENSAQGTKTTQRIALTDTANDWIATHESALADLSSPIYQPMIVPPRPWSSLSEGGCLATPLNLVKRQGSSRAQQRLEDAGLSVVCSAVNAMQNTPFRINREIDRIMREAWAAGYLLFGLPTHTVAPLPPSLPGDADPKQIKKRKRERKDAFNLNNRIKGLKKMMALRLSQAERLLDEPQFYFPYQLDHRGRAYPVPQLINPQSDDTGRSPLEFAEGKPLGEHGAYWLKIQLANSYWKGNKVSFEDRLAWVDQHEAEILAFAKDPFGFLRFWAEADKPWTFLRTCLEWKGYREQGPEFLSHLPVSMDGTCNGYQHLSALGLDPIGGRATNLIPGDKPEDMYLRTSDRVNLRIERDAESGSGDDQEAARQLLGKIDRSGVKVATMTTPYGVTRGRIYKQLLESEPVKSCKDPEICARYLAKVLEKCIPEVAVEAGKIMKWLRELARVLAKANRGMVWTTPAGLPVSHETREQKAQRIATADCTLVVYMEDETRKIDARKLADGIVAHLVHSLDATHMVFTVNRLYAEGIRHFAMVHDSFGVHACDIDLLHRVLREEFVRIYSEPVLQNFFKGLWEANTDLHLPALPPPGNLDIRQVLSSPYFFA